ncbi:hypothetical protein [Botryobacter ruber]|uniref:hypothetical protein n=1 Tax=Botryobacter ruber TaxID=2171629 RepID=UPI0013E36272|nr:hypothetical protein [Botryobacter ruber]
MTIATGPIPLTTVTFQKIKLPCNEVLKWFGGREEYRSFHQKNAADFSTIAPLIEEDEL